jgi:hypothetical protein
MDAAPQIDADLLEMVEHHRIRKVLAAYCHGCDRADWERMRDVYAEDSWDDHGAYKGSGRAFPDHVKGSYAQRHVQCTHQLGQSQIRLDGDEAGAETYFIACIFPQPEHDNGKMTLMGGRYADTLVREADGWKVKHRTCVRDWSVTLDTTEDTLRNGNFVPGMLTGDDASYALLALQHSASRFGGA